MIAQYSGLLLLSTMLNASATVLGVQYINGHYTFCQPKECISRSIKHLDKEPFVRSVAYPSAETVADADANAIRKITKPRSRKRSRQVKPIRQTQ